MYSKTFIAENESRMHVSMFVFICKVTIKFSSCEKFSVFVPIFKVTLKFSSCERYSVFVLIYQVTISFSSCLQISSTKISPVTH